MKKIIILFIMTFCLCSCATYATYGDVSILNYAGDTIRKWDNSVIEKVASTNVVNSGIKAGGALNFQDSEGTYHYVNGGIIIVDNLVLRELGSTSARKEVANREELKKLIAQYEEVKQKYDANKKAMRKFDKNSDEYIQKRAETEDYLRQMNAICNKGYKIGGYPSDFGRSGW